jgi:hypothetical protein
MRSVPTEREGPGRAAVSAAIGWAGQLDGDQTGVVHARRQRAVSDRGIRSRIDLTSPDRMECILLGCEANQPVVRHSGLACRVTLDLSDDHAQTRIAIGAEVAI